MKNKLDMKEFFYKYLVNSFIYLEILCSVFLYVLVILNIPTQNGDNIEHIHSTFMVANGDVPYRDFFQHHNPLLWFIFAPLVKIFAYDTTVAEILLFISFLVFLKSLVYVYNITKEFLADKFWATVAVLLVIVPTYKIFAIDFRPDNYMVFALMAGIYYYFSYLRDKKTQQLVVSFIWFVLAFLFAQKALFPLFVLGLSGLYFWYKKEIKTSDLIKSLIAPIIMTGGCFAYLAYYKIVKLYFVSNFTFNLNLVEGFEMGRFAKMYGLLIFSIVGALLGAGCAIGSKNRYWRILALLFIVEFLQRKYYFSPYIYYYWLLMYVAVLTFIPLLKIIDESTRLVRVVVVGICLFFLYNGVMFHLNNILNTKQGHEGYLPYYITKRITPCDYVFNGNGLMYNIFGKDPHYYWQLIGQLDVVGEKTGIAPKPNINKIIFELKPKFIYGKSYFNKFADESGRKEIVHYIDKDLLDRYYKPAPFSGIYELKEEYWRECNIKKL